MYCSFVTKVNILLDDKCTLSNFACYTWFLVKQQVHHALLTIFFQYREHRIILYRGDLLIWEPKPTIIVILLFSFQGIIIPTNKMYDYKTVRPLFK